MPAVRAAIPTGVIQLTDNLGTASQVVAVNSTATALEFVPAPAATVSVGSFANTGNVDFAASGALVEANYEGLGASGTGLATPLTSGVTSLNVTAAGLVVSFASGVLTIGNAAPPPAAAVFTENFAAPPASAFTAVTPPTNTITPGANTSINVVTSVITGGPVGVPTNIEAVVTDSVTNLPVDNTAGTTNPVTVTFPASGVGAADFSDPGEYIVTTTTTATGPAGRTTTMERDTFTRFLPFVQSRTDFAVAADVTGGTVSTSAWPADNTFTIIPASPGITSVFIAIDATAISTVTTVRDTVLNFVLNSRILRTLQVPNADGDLSAYTIIQIAGATAGRQATITP